MYRCRSVQRETEAMRRKIWSAKELEAAGAATGGESTAQLGGEGVTRGGEGGTPVLSAPGGEGAPIDSDIRLKDRIERIGIITVAGDSWKQNATRQCRPPSTR